MALTLIESAPGDYRNARYLALAVDLAYFNEPEGTHKFRDELGLDAKLIGVGNTQVYVGGNNDHIVAAFRGSENPATLDGLKDWLLTNANNLLVLPEGLIGTDFAAAGVGARFHRGFMQALDAIWQPFFQAVDSAFAAKVRPVWVCGHSLGGALALLASWRLERNFVPVHQVFTFGAPMIGNEAAAAAFEREMGDRVFRFIDCHDLVPKLPTVSLTSNEYGHCPREMLLGEDVPPQNAFSQLAAAGGGLLTAGLMNDLWGYVLRGVNSHLMNNYRSRIDNKCG